MHVMFTIQGTGIQLAAPLGPPLVVRSMNV